MRPDEALQRLQLSEIKDSSLKEERDKVGKAKEALDSSPASVRLFSRYTSSPIEEYQDFQVFDDVSVNHTIKNTRADNALYSLVPEMDESCQSTESNLDRREQLTWDEVKLIAQ